MRKNSSPTDPCGGTPPFVDSNWKTTGKRLFDVYCGGMTQSIEDHSRLSHCF